MNNQIQLVLKSSTTELSLNDRELGIYLTPELEGLTGLPEIRTTSGVNAGYDGGWTSAQNYDARSITIRGVIANEDVATVEQLRRQLTTLAGQGKNEELTLDLVTQAGKAYTIQVRTIALEMSLQKVLCQQEFMLQLRADDPLVYDASETTHEALLRVAQATGGFTIDFELPLAITGSSEETIVNNEGLEQVPTVTRMYGELHNPKIINQTTNQFMQIEADLGFAEGEWTTPSEPVEGKNLAINGAPENAPLSDFDLKGNTEQTGTPTPSAPVPVKVVTGENVVKICGKNLLDPSILEVGNITAQGVDSASTQVVRSDYIYLKAGNYALRVNDANNQIKIFRYVTYDTSKTFVSSSSPTAKQTTITMSADGYLRLCFYNDPWRNITVDEIVASNVQLELGSTATEYEPYQGQSYEVNLGKNLFDGSIYKENYVIASNGAENPATGGVITTAVRVEPNTTYTASVNWDASSPDKYMRVGIYDSDMTFISRPSSAAAGAPTTFTTPANARYVRLSYFVPATEVQLELGSQATSYAAYFTPIELCKIGDYQDSIYKSGGKWYVRKEIGKVVKTGASSETWTKSNSTANNLFIGIQNDMVKDRSSLNFPVYSDRFLYKDRGTIYAQSVVGITTQTTGGGESAFRIGMGIDSSVNTVELFRTWLSNNPTTIYYPLATPTDTEITNEALVAQLEAILQEAKMYNPQTNITSIYAAGNVQGTLSVSYFTDKNPDTRDELIIDSRLRTITLNGLDVYHLQAPGSEFLMLAPGENRLALQSDITGDNGYAQVSYKQGYLSI